MSTNDRHSSQDLIEDVPATSAGSGQIEGMGVGPKGEPGAKKLGYKKGNEKVTLKKLKQMKDEA